MVAPVIENFERTRILRTHVPLSGCTMWPIASAESKAILRYCSSAARALASSLRHGAKLIGLLRAAREIASVPVLILFDTGGVRLQEANAGELAIAEIMIGRFTVDVRNAVYGV